MVAALFPKLLNIQNESRNTWVIVISTPVTFQYTIKVMILVLKKNGVKYLEMLCPQIHSFFLVLVIYRHLLLK